MGWEKSGIRRNAGGTPTVFRQGGKGGEIQRPGSELVPEKGGKFFLMMRSTERMIDNTAQIRFC
jgi:hypothetical protein